VKLFLAKFRGKDVVTLDKLVPFGPISGTVYEFKVNKSKLYNLLSVKGPKLIMEKWDLSEQSIYEASTKTSMKHYQRDMTQFKKIVKEYEQDLEKVFTKTKWAFDIFENNGGKK
jgi:hypothetical protein